MANVLILGANGKIAKIAEKQLMMNPDYSVTLFLRDAKRLAVTESDQVKIIEGDAANIDDVKNALKDITIVYANLGNHGIEEQALTVVSAMKAAGIKRLIWISTLGIYDEVPGKFGEWNHQMLDGGYLETYSSAAKIIENSGLDYTIIRPAWLSNKDIISYETTQKGELFKGTEVSRKSIADLVVKLIDNPDQEINHSIGVNEPNTDGDKPSFY